MNLLGASNRHFFALGTTILGQLKVLLKTKTNWKAGENVHTLPQNTGLVYEILSRTESKIKFIPYFSSFVF